jgi:GTP-binding protein
MRRRSRSTVPSSTTPLLIEGLEAGDWRLGRLAQERTAPQPQGPASVKITAEFVKSAASETDFPPKGMSAIALVGRSNVGKSSLINALVRCRVARTSATPGKTRLANIYRVVRGSSRPLDVVDLPGYGYARGGASGLDGLTRAIFGQEGRERRERLKSALLLVDPRHPGLTNDVAAWRWLQETVPNCAIVATKIDKLARGQRIRALRELESVFDHSVLPVSAVTGEGLDDLWKLIDTLTNRKPTPPSRTPHAETAPPRHPNA